jgi:hypothetical protein
MRAATSIQSGELLDQLLAAPNVLETHHRGYHRYYSDYQHGTLIDEKNEHKEIDGMSSSDAARRGAVAMRSPETDAFQAQKPRQVTPKPSNSRASALKSHITRSSLTPVPAGYMVRHLVRFQLL